MKKTVAIRKQGKEYLVYFFEQRTTTQINEMGAKVLEAFLNNGKSVNEISHEIAKSFGITVEQASKDVKVFLANIYNRIITTNVNEAEQKMLDSPLGVEIEITTACNLRCKHCF